MSYPRYATVPRSSSVESTRLPAERPFAAPATAEPSARLDPETGHPTTRRQGHGLRQAPHASIHLQTDGVIQGYSIVQPANLRAQKDATVETQDVARTRYGSTYVRKSAAASHTGFAPATQETTTERVSGVQHSQASNLPPFKVSQNGLLAVPAEGQAKNLYTDPATVNLANRTLKYAGALARLKTLGHGITVPQNPTQPDNLRTRTLKKAHAAMEVRNQDTNRMEIAIQQAFPAVQCNEFIRYVTGAAANASRVAVLEGPGGPDTRREVVAQEAEEPIKEIATHMSQGRPKRPRGIKHLLEHQQLDEPQRKTGMRAFENLSEASRSARARRLGINEFADPQVGEGMVIRSMDTNAILDDQAQRSPVEIVEPGTNSRHRRSRLRQRYSQALQDLDVANQVADNSRAGVSARVQGMMKTWGEHYAGVIGRDGPDMVTLENYNRATEVSWEHERIFNNLFRDFQQFRNLVSARVNHLNATPDEATIRELVRLAGEAPDLEANYEAALAEATGSFETGLRRTAETFTGNFYFAMYGPGDQSFHSQFKGMASNPMTLRVKETLQPVVQRANDTLQELRDLIARWEGPIQAHPVTGYGIQDRMLSAIRHARQVEATAARDIAAATTRGEYHAAADLAGNEAWNVLRPEIEQAIRGAYQIITGEAPNPGIYNMADLVARATTYIGTYSWHQRIGARYRAITSLQATAQACVDAGFA